MFGKDYEIPLRFGSRPAGSTCTHWLSLGPPELREVCRTRVQGSRADMLGCDWPGVTSSLSSVVDFTSGFEQSGGQASAHAGSGCPR